MPREFRSRDALTRTVSAASAMMPPTTGTAPDRVSFAALVYAPLQQTFENALQDYIQRNTRLTITDGASDLEMSGEITGYALTPQAVTEDAYASKTRLTITVRVKYVDNKDDKNSIDQSFSAYRDFDATQLLIDVQDQLCQEISEELVDLIFNATLGNW